jgi:nucleoporin POM34
MSSTTALVQRTQQTIAQTANNALAPARNTTDRLSSALSTATSNLTPQKLSAASPSTPHQQQQQQHQQPTSSPAQLTPGQWQHPRMQEVIQRQNKTRFDAGSMRVIARNAGIMLATFLLPLAYAMPSLPTT